MERKRDEFGFITPHIGILQERLFNAVKWTDSMRAARLGMWFERWCNRQPLSRWMTAAAAEVMTPTVDQALAIVDDAEEISL